MNVARTRSIIRIVATTSLTALLTACVLYLLLARLGDRAGTWWAGRLGFLAAVAMVVTVTALSLIDSRGESADSSPAS
jgi:hypothetical protein